MLLTEAPDGGWGLAGHANTNEELVAAARAQIASLQALPGRPRMTSIHPAIRKESNTTKIARFTRHGRPRLMITAAVLAIGGLLIPVSQIGLCRQLDRRAGGGDRTDLLKGPMAMDGANALMRTLVESGITTLFTNPGTTELHLVEAAEATPGLRSVLALFEGVVSGAADGYGRIAGRPAATLVHLGPGQGNAWANFHNARRARTPIVSLIGDHATYHKRFDPPLESDIAAVARALDSAVRTPRIAEQVSSCAASAVADAASAPGRISTVIMPADVSWSPTETMAAPVPPSPASIVPGERIERIAALAGRGAQTVLLLGGAACREEGLRAASRIAAATGIPVFTETSPARLEHGAGLPDFPRLGFYPEQAVAQLKGASHVLLAGVHEPVAMGFAYLGQPSSPVPADAAMVTLAAPDEDAVRALTDLAAIVAPGTAATVAAVARARDAIRAAHPAVVATGTGSAPAGGRHYRR